MHIQKYIYTYSYMWVYVYSPKIFSKKKYYKGLFIQLDIGNMVFILMLIF